MHDDVPEPAHVQHVVLILVQDVAAEVCLEHQAVAAEALSEQFAVGIRSVADAACLEAVDLAL